MSDQLGQIHAGRVLLMAALLSVLPMLAQQQRAGAQQQSGPTKQGDTAKQGGAAKQSGPAKPEQKITPAQARELFASVDTILAFASKDSQLPIYQPVKRRLTTRAEVEHYILEKMKDDKDAQRLQSSEIVLKKFGLLDRDFQLKPFIVTLLTEQIAGYYDSKTKTVNMLDWIVPEEQKPVLAHELTHALQDQHVDLEKWGDRSKQDTAKNVQEDNDHLATDEEDTAREAVAEGQAMVVFLDWGLAPKGQSLAKMPDIGAQLNDMDGDDDSSPVLKRAPLLLKESLLFPYREGLNFEQVVLKDQGAKGAFAGALDHPPVSSYEVMHPKTWERHVRPTLLTMPDIHPLIDADYAPYDIGVMGALDVRILTELFAGKDAAVVLTPQWDGGIYYAAQSRKAITPELKAKTDSVALLYLSQWKTEEAAEQFAAIYADDLTRKYTTAHKQPADDTSTPGETLYSTEEGPVLIAVVGRGVYISESFPLPLARKLELTMTGVLEHGGQQDAILRSYHTVVPRTELSAGIASWLHSCGMLRAARLK